MAHTGDPRGPMLRLPFGNNGLPFAIDAQASVRSGTDADVSPIAPVEQVVAALLARRRMIGYLVGGQAGALGHLLSDLVKAPCRLSIGHGEFAGSMQLSERRLRLDGELIKRQVPA